MKDLDAILDEWTTSVLGMLCWSVVAGGMTSFVSIAIGGRKQRGVPLSNPTLTQEQRQFNSEFKIFVKGAFWQLRQAETIVTDSSEDCSPNGPMALGVQGLVGSRVAAVQFDPDTRSLRVDFEPGALKLQIRGDVVNGWDGCYSLFFPDRILAIDGNDGWRTEGRDD